MAITDQFAGLQMDKLIGAPLTAAADASISLANSTADFINRVGFDKDGRVRNVAFGFHKRSANEDGTSNLDEMKINVPMLAIVPIPNLQVDEVNVLFDMEVKQSEKSESSMDIGASITGKLDLGIFSVSVTGSVSAHNSNTRSSDNSAKYHVDVRATNHGTPEGLARVLDMMAAAVSPSLVGSTVKDGNGQDLPAAAREKAEKLKALRAQVMMSERKVAAAQEGVDTGITMLKDLATSQLNVYHGIAAKINSAEKPDEKEKKEVNDSIQIVSQTWSDFSAKVSKLIEMVADGPEETSKISDIFGLKSMDTAGKVSNYAEDKTAEKYTVILSAQNRATASQKVLSAARKEMLEKKTEYAAALSGVEASSGE